jgi:hypothetical protein
VILRADTTEGRRRDRGAGTQRIRKHAERTQESVEQATTGFENTPNEPKNRQSRQDFAYGLSES